MKAENPEPGPPKPEPRMQNSESRSRRRGTTLIEVTVAFIVIVLAMVSAAALVGRHARTVRDLFEEKTAVQIAEGEIEALEARGFDGVGPGETALAPPGAAMEQLRGGRCVLVVERDAEDARLLRTRVRVRWRPQGNMTREVEVDTWVRR